MAGRVVPLFLFVAAAQGVPYLLTAIAMQQTQPALLVLLRAAGAAAVLLPLAAARQEIVPALRRWRALVLFAAVEIAVPWTAIAVAERTVASSMAGSVVAAVPLAGVVVGLVARTGERLTWRNAVGLLLGFTGVAALLGPDLGSATAGSVALLVIAVLGYAVGAAMLVTSLRGLSGIAVTGIAFAVVSVGCLPWVLITRAWWSDQPDMSVSISVALLAVVCSAGGFGALAALVKRVGPVRASTVTYLSPVIATGLGVLVLGEPLRPAILPGFAATVVGALLSTTHATRRTNRRPVSQNGAIAQVGAGSGDQGGGNTTAGMRDEMLLRDRSAASAATTSKGTA